MNNIGKAPTGRLAAGATGKAAESAAALTGKAAVPAAGMTGKATESTAAKMAAIPVSAALTGKAAVPAAEKTRAVEFSDAISAASSHFATCFVSIAVGRHNLPHWGLDSTIVFVTFRLADSVPEHILSQWREELREWAARHSEPLSEEARHEYMSLFPNRMEKWLDRGHGNCILADGNCRNIVASAIEHFNGERYRLHSYVIMPNHVHVLLELSKRDDLPRVLHSWKSFTAKELNKILGTSGEVWMRDYHDRIVRNAEHYKRCLAYIRKNAEAAAKMAAIPVSAALTGKTAVPAAGVTGKAAESTAAKIYPPAKSCPRSGCASRGAAIPVSAALTGKAAVPAAGMTGKAAVPAAQEQPE